MIRCAQVIHIGDISMPILFFAFSFRVMFSRRYADWRHIKSNEPSVPRQDYLSASWTSCGCLFMFEPSL
jgi:hypothetical protein